jgi:hypothetical protein
MVSSLLGWQTDDSGKKATADGEAGRSAAAHCWDKFRKAQLSSLPMCKIEFISAVTVVFVVRQLS